MRTGWTAWRCPKPWRVSPCHAMLCCAVPCLAAVLGPKAVEALGGSGAQGPGAAVPMERGVCAVPCPAPCLCGCAVASVRLRRSRSIPGHPCLHLVTHFPYADAGPRQKPVSSPHGETLTGTEGGGEWGQGQAMGCRGAEEASPGDRWGCRWGDSHLGAPPPRPSPSPCLQRPGVPGSPLCGAEASFPHRSALSWCHGAASAPGGSSLSLAPLGKFQPCCCNSQNAGAAPLRH